MISYESLLRSAQYARDAYLTQKELNVLYHDADHIVTFEYTEKFLDVQGYIIVYENDATVVFRGTESFKDWIHNARALQVDSPYGKVHKGFWNSWESIKSTVFGCCSNLEEKRIWIVGHSLGAACATICALDMKSSGFNIHRVVTFGSPKVGGDEWKDNYNTALGERTDRVRNCNDIVCDIPDTPGKTGGRYDHVSTLHYINSKGMLLIGTSSKDRCFDRMIGFVKTAGTGLVTNHSMKQYIKHIEAYVNK